MSFGRFLDFCRARACPIHCFSENTRQIARCRFYLLTSLFEFFGCRFLHAICSSMEHSFEIEDEDGAIQRINKQLAKIKASKVRGLASDSRPPCPPKRSLDDGNESELEEEEMVSGKKKKNADLENNAKGLLSEKQRQNKNTKWTNQLVTQLIDLLEERPCLWNVCDKNYHMRGMRDLALTEISQNLKVQKDEVKAKILTLRSQLGREIAKVNATKSGQAVDDLYKTNWIHWDRLQFLKLVMQPGKSRDTLQVTTPSVSDNSSQSFEDENSSPIVPNHGVRSSKSSMKSLMEQKQELLSTCIKVLKEPIEQKATVCHFSNFVAEKLSQMDKRTRAIAEKRIYDILFEIEMNGVGGLPPNHMPPSQLTSQGYHGSQLNSVTQMNSGNYMSLLEY